MREVVVIGAARAAIPHLIQMLQMVALERARGVAVRWQEPITAMVLPPVLVVREVLDRGQVAEHTAALADIRRATAPVMAWWAVAVAVVVKKATLAVVALVAMRDRVLAALAALAELKLGMAPT